MPIKIQSDLPVKEILEKENIYGGEGRVVYVLNEEGKCIPRYINN